MPLVTFVIRIVASYLERIRRGIRRGSFWFFPEKQPAKVTKLTRPNCIVSAKGTPKGFVFGTQEPLLPKAAQEFFRRVVH
jgi:hypothetical protein